MVDNGPVVVEFIGYCSKKNRKAPRPDGKGLFIERKTRQMLDRMELQVPPYARGRLLDNPEVEWFFTYTNAHIDIDGIMASVLDILQKYGVIVNDNIAHFGNRQVIHPAVRGETDTVKVVLIPRAVEEDPSPRYIQPRRERVTLPRVEHNPPTIDDFEDLEGEEF